MNLRGATITGGGTLTTAAGGLMENAAGGTATLTGVTISTGSTFTAQNNSTTTLQSTITNNGTLLLNSVGLNTDLVIHGTVNNTGAGAITMSNTTANRIYGSSSSDTLVNDTSNTIQGSGQIGTTQLTLNNKGLIDANQSSALTIGPNAAVTNTGTLRASRRRHRSTCRPRSTISGAPFCPPGPTRS